VYFYDIFKNLIMKTKDILLVGAGATIIYLLWRRSKKAKDLKGLAGTNGTIGGTSGATTGATTGATNGATNGAISSEPEQVYGLQLPPNMDLPNLTGGTGISTEVAVQQGGVITTPTPIISNTPIMSIEDSLSAGNISPIKPILPVVSQSPCQQKWEYYSQTIKPSSQQAYDEIKSKFFKDCDGTYIAPSVVKFPKDLSVSQDVLPVSSEEYQSNIIKNKGELHNAPATLSANGLNSRGRVINARLYRGVM
jgi:hypothetical protein